MNWNAIGALSEILAAIGVVVSLVYLAMQIRMSRAENRSASIDRLVELWGTYVGALADNPQLAVIVAKGLHDYGQLEVAERAQVSAHLSRIMRVSEAIFMHYRDDTIDPELWTGINSSLDDISNMPLVSQWWPTRRHWFGETFSNHIDSLIQNGKPTDVYPAPS